MTSESSSSFLMGMNSCSCFGVSIFRFDVFGLNFAANRFKIELFPASLFESVVEVPVIVDGLDICCSGSLFWFVTFCV